MSIAGLGNNNEFLPLTLYNDFQVFPVSGSLDLFTFAPSSSDGDLVVGDSHGDGTPLTQMFSKMGLFVFNNHKSNQLISYEDSLNLISLGKFSSGKNYASESLNFYTDSYQGHDQNTDLTDGSTIFSNQSKTIFATAAKMPLFLKAEPPTPEQNFSTLNLFTYNIYGSNATFEWDGFNYGSQIDADDNFNSALTLDNEIRGVTTVGYGNCKSDSPAKAIEQDLVIDSVVYAYGQCNDAGIFRAVST